MGHLLCFGEALFELSDLGDGMWREGIGGDISNVAIAASRQGAKTRIISRLGCDLFGDRIRHAWDREGVDHSQVEGYRDAPTGVYMITYEAGEHQFSYRRSGSAASLMNSSDFDAGSIAPFAKGSFLHLSGITMAIGSGPNELGQALARLMCQSGGTVCYDPNLRLTLTSLDAARTDQEAIFAAGATIALPGLDDARLLTGLHDPEEIVPYYHDLGAEIVALTCGASGAMISDKQRCVRISPPTCELVDASGAGDCFNGAFISRLLAGETPEDAGRYAVTAASLSIGGHGAVGAIPLAAQVEALMEKTAIS